MYHTLQCIMIVKKHRKETVSCIRENFLESAILRSSTILSSKRRINPYLENIDEIWQ